MIANGTDNLVSWIRHNKLKSWSLARKNSLKENTIVWSSNADVDFDANVEDMLSTLECLDGGNVYIISRDKGSVSNAGECWRVPEKNGATDAPISGYQQPIQPAVPIGYVSREELDQRIDDAVKRVQFENERKQFEQERAEFKRERKEFENTRDGIIGTLITKAAPIIEPYLARLAPRVAGLDSEQQMQAEPIAAVNQDDALENETAEADVFSDAESDKLFDLCERWKRADEADYLKILEKIVQFSESGKEAKVFGMSFGYDKVKSMLLDFEL